MGWLKRNAESIEALATSATALIAIAALVGVKWQIDAHAELQAQQSARDIYRGFLEHSMARPEFAHPDACLGISGPERPDYDAYLEYLLYTSEQVTALDPAWGQVMAHWLERHQAQLCTWEDFSDVTPQVGDLIRQTRGADCPQSPVCE